MATKSVAPPKGYHWMKAGKGYKLMKGAYHKGAVKRASFEVQEAHTPAQERAKGKKKK